MLAVRVRFNLLKDIAAIPLDHISADDFAARFLAIVARQVPEEAQESVWDSSIKVHGYAAVSEPLS